MKASKTTIKKTLVAAGDARKEALQAANNWPTYNSAHEGWGVLLEEIDELKKHVYMKQKNRNINEMRKEAIQVAAVAIRFAADICNEKVGRK